MSDISLPLIALKGLIVFPGMTIQFDAVRRKSINALKKAMESNQMVVFCAQKDADKDEISVSDIYTSGTISRVKQVVRVNEKMYRVIAEGINRASVADILSGSEYFTCIASYLLDTNNDEEDVEIAALCRKARNLYIEYMDYTKKYIKTPQAVLNITKPSVLTDVICSTLNVTIEELQKLLCETDVKKRLEKIIVTLTKEINIFAYEKIIDKSVNENVDKNQKEYYLREKLKVIKDELGMSFDAQEDEAEYEQKIRSLKLDEQYEDELLNEVKKLSYVG
ncbi:MAG: LON peptidase substrate-binding domain-containing protein, partial [Clostridia bacterium]|nr:LON peptidase substrate-binding domain-containing protein [Clostridia bacterium]